jgi:CHAT domain-containing protein
VPAARRYGQVLAWKGTVAARQAEDRLARDRPDLRPALEKLRAARAGLAKLANTPPTPVGQKAWLERFDRLEEEEEKWELELADASAAFRRLREQRSATAAQVAGALPPRTAFVDFLVYNHISPDPQKKGRWKEERRLLAFVLARGRDPVGLDLGPADALDAAARAWLQPVQAAQAVDEQAARELRRRVWLPVQQHLAGARTVLVSPDGSLCHLPLAALPGATPRTFLLEEYALGYLPSGRHLLDLTADEARFKSAGLLAVGHLAYGRPLAGPPAPGVAADGLPRYDGLPGTRLEVERIGALFRQQFPAGPAPRLVTGTAADKAGLQRALAPAPGVARWRYLHLATHGYCAAPRTPPTRRPVQEPSPFADLAEQRTWGRNPLLLSGLALAGANRSREEGLLTAEEVAGLDLRGCEVAVLSACETALGRVDEGEGVSGLQQAFHAAGARTLVASLWSVSDPATSLLMEEFYQNLWGDKKLSRLEALRQAQLTVLRNPARVRARAQELAVALAQRGLAVRGPSQRPVPLAGGGRIDTDARSHPALWAAFVLSGDSQ